MPFHAKLRPILQFLLDIGLCGLRLQPERVPAQVNAVFSTLRLGNVKTLAKVSQRIAGVQLRCKLLAELKWRNCQFSSSGGSSRCISLSDLFQSRSSTRSMPEQS